MKILYMQLRLAFLTNLLEGTAVKLLHNKKLRQNLAVASLKSRCRFKGRKPARDDMLIVWIMNTEWNQQVRGKHISKSIVDVCATSQTYNA